MNYRTYPAGTDVKTFTIADAEKSKAKMEKVSQTLLNPTDYTKGTTIKVEKTLVPVRLFVLFFLLVLKL